LEKNTIHPTQPPEANETIEEHFTAAEVADALKVSPNYVIKRFSEEEGVVVLDHINHDRHTSRPYKSLRIRAQCWIG
jgi:hypothetical protein